MMTFLRNKTLIRILVASIIVLALFNLYSFYLLKLNSVPLNGQKIYCSDESSDKLEILRLSDEDLKLTQPLMLFDQSTEAEVFSELKSKVTDIIETNKKVGKLEQAAVYIRTMNDSRWTAINGNMLFNPASMLKMSIMICFFKTN